MIKKKILRRLMLSSFTVLSILFANNSMASAEWRASSVTYSDGSISSVPWYAEGNSWATGWRYIDNYWYYFDPQTGYSVSGWNYIDGNWYWFRPTIFIYEGSRMGTNLITRENGKYYYVNSDGIYIENPPNEVSQYILLLKDRDRMIDMGILSKNKIPQYLIGKYYVNDDIISITLDDDDNDGILSMNVSTYLSDYMKMGNINILYKNGQFYKNGQSIGSSVANSSSAVQKSNIFVTESGINFDETTGNIFAYRSKVDGIDNLIIPSTINGVSVKTIGTLAFAGSEMYHKSITIPESITQFEKDAFMHCDNITFYIYNENTKKMLINSGIKEKSIIMKNN